MPLRCATTRFAQLGHALPLWKANAVSTCLAVGAFCASASAIFLLQSVDTLEKARQGLPGSLLLLKSGGWGYIPLDKTSVQRRE